MLKSISLLWMDFINIYVCYFAVEQGLCLYDVDNVTFEIKSIVSLDPLNVKRHIYWTFPNQIIKTRVIIWAGGFPGGNNFTWFY